MKAASADVDAKVMIVMMTRVDRILSGDTIGYMYV